jgi:endonuclease-8
VHPDRPGASLSEDEVRLIWDTTVEQLRLGLKRNRIVTVPLAGRSVSRIPAGETFHVYKQDRCRSCGADVERATVGSRNSFACATCQPR